MPNPLLIKLQTLIDDAKCFNTVRKLRWPEGIMWCACQSTHVIKRGFNETQPLCQRYQCKVYLKRFADLSDTIFAGHHQPLQTWILYLYLMGLNLSNPQLSQHLDLNKDDIHDMATLLRSGIVSNTPIVSLEGIVECNEAYVISGHKGQAELVKLKGRKGRRRRLKPKCDRGTLEKEKLPIFGMIQRQGEVILKMLPNVKQVTSQPLVSDSIVTGTLILTDEYSIYSRLKKWG